jgi:hypothetical protein
MPVLSERLAAVALWVLAQSPRMWTGAAPDSDAPASPMSVAREDDRALVLERRHDLWACAEHLTARVRYASASSPDWAWVLAAITSLPAFFELPVFITPVGITCLTWLYRREASIAVSNAGIPGYVPEDGPARLVVHRATARWIAFAASDIDPEAATPEQRERQIDVRRHFSHEHGPPGFAKEIADTAFRFLDVATPGCPRTAEAIMLVACMLLGDSSRRGVDNPLDWYTGSSAITRCVSSAAPVTAADDDL